MKKILVLIFVILVIPLAFFANTNHSSGSCTVKQIYSAIIPESGVKAITDMGEITDVSVILSPVSIDPGEYSVSLTRKASNLYKIEGTDYYIETTYCYEFATYDDAILEVESSYGYSIGTITFN